MQTTLQWKPDEQFTISGLDMETVISILTQQISSAECQQTIRVYECLRSLQQSIQTGIVQGKVQEILS